MNTPNIDSKVTRMQALAAAASSKPEVNLDFAVALKSQPPAHHAVGQMQPRIPVLWDLLRAK